VPEVRLEAPQRFDAVQTPPLQFNLPLVETLQLPNGMRVYLKEDHELPLVEMTLMVGAGSIDDPLDRTGQGALYAAALRTGGAGERAPEAVDLELERLAADFSVAGDSYATTLSLSLQADDLDTGLSLLADTLRRPGFDPGRLELARKQQIEAVRRQNDEPEAIAARLLRQAIYGDHPLGRTPSEATLQTVSRADLLAFHQRYVQPGNLWLAISGDFDRIQLLTLLLEAFGDWPATPVPAQPLPAVTAAARPVLLLVQRELPQTVIQLGELGIDKSAPDLEAVRVMNYILGGGGFNSRLMSDIRSDRGLAYSVYSYYQVGRRLPGLFLAGSETKGASALEVVQRLRTQMEQMRAEPVTEDELRLAKESLINSFVFAFADSHEVAAQAMRLDFYGYPPDYLSGFRDRVAAVDAAAVQQAARDRLHPERMTLVLVGDERTFAAPAASLGLPVETVAP
jgi:zinc protease